MLRASGPALLFEQPVGYKIPVPDQPVPGPRGGSPSGWRSGARRTCTRGRAAAGQPEGADPPKALKRGRGAVADGQGGVGHEAGHRPPSGLPGGGLEGPGGGPLAAAGADLLARRCRSAADHLGARRHARAAGRGAARRRQNLGIYRQRSSRRTRRSCAGSRASRRRARLPRLRPRQPGRPFLVAVALGGSGDDARRRDAGSRCAVGGTSSPGCCAAAGRAADSAVGEGG